jgi:hypothetical protein
MQTVINVVAVFVFIGCLAGAFVNWFAFRKGLTFGQSAWEGLNGSEASQRRLTAMRNFAICLAIAFVTGILLAIVDQ